MSKKLGSKVVAVDAPKSVINQLMGLYIIIAFLLALAWYLGSMSFSFLWIFGIIFALFVLWKSKLCEIVESTLETHKEHQNRKRALRQEETVEWLNFIFNRWWVFCSVSIEDLVKRRINDRLHSVKPAFIGQLELNSFTFGDITPCIRCIKAYECLDGVRGGFKPASWSNVISPPAGLERMSTFQIVLEADTASRCEDFRMVFRARAGGEKVGLNFDIAVEELKIQGKIQVVLHLSMEIPFPHITKATVSFTEIPEVWFNVSVLKALRLMEVPLLKSWIHINVMEGITKALVDPGKLDIPVATVGPVNSQQLIQQKPKLAQGVLTIQLKGTPSLHADEAIHYTQLKVGRCKRQTSELPATSTWEDCCSFFIHDLSHEKLNIKHKCKRLLTTVTLQQCDLELSSFPFNLTKQLGHDIENEDGSKLSLLMDYSPLPPISLVEEEPVNILQKSGVLYVCVHCAHNVMAMDRTGSSDPYCVVFCDRRRVMTTPYIAQNRSPCWESQTEFFVKDFAQCQLSFYVFDWDGTNTIDDDFLGSAMHAMSEDEPVVLKKTLTLGCNKQSQGHTTDVSLGQIIISIIFRPVPSVLKSEKHRLTSTDSMNNNSEFLYIEDMVSPGTTSIIDHVQRSSENSEKAGSRLTSKSSSRDEDFLKGKVFVDLGILQAKDLIPMDRNGYSDPFCVVKMDDKKLFSTSVKKKTLFPKWNESVTLQLTEGGGMLDIELYDKDIMINDFLGKISLTVDQLKEISLRGSSEWFHLQHVRSGQLEIMCTVTATESLKKGSARSEVSATESRQDHSKGSPVRALSSDSNVFVSPPTSLIKSDNNGQLPRQKSRSVALPDASSPIRDESVPPLLKESPVPSSLKRSASDVNMGRRPSQTNSLNSFTAFQDLDVTGDVKSAEKTDTPPESEEGTASRIFNVTGKLLSVQGLKFTEGTIYCKVRVISPHRHRLRQIFGSRVIAKSPMIKASKPAVNLPIDVDRGMGVSGDTLLKFDVKSEGKEHLASKAYTVQSLFSGPGGDADKIQKVLPLENNLQVELYLQHSLQEDSTFLRRRHGGRSAGISRSARKTVA